MNGILAVVHNITHWLCAWAHFR